MLHSTVCFPHIYRYFSVVSGAPSIMVLTNHEKLYHLINARLLTVSRRKSSFFVNSKTSWDVAIYFAFKSDSFLSSCSSYVHLWSGQTRINYVRSASHSNEWNNIPYPNDCVQWQENKLTIRKYRYFWKRLSGKISPISFVPNSVVRLNF